MFKAIRYAMGDRQRARQIALAEGAATGKKGRGKHAAPPGGVQCNHQWTDPGIPGSRHATYPHKDHRCGDAPHNRGDHHCHGGDNWTCAATTAY